MIITNDFLSNWYIRFRQIKRDRLMYYIRVERPVQALLSNAKSFSPSRVPQLALASKKITYVRENNEGADNFRIIATMSAIARMGRWTHTYIYNERNGSKAPSRPFAVFSFLFIITRTFPQMECSTPWYVPQVHAIDHPRYMGNCPEPLDFMS